jgi:hypothetical protein
MGMRYCFIAVTDRRVLFFSASPMTVKPRDPAWADPQGAGTISDIDADPGASVSTVGPRVLPHPHPAPDRDAAHPCGASFGHERPVLAMVAVSRCRPP